jgi:hypothetical protein
MLLAAVRTQVDTQIHPAQSSVFYSSLAICFDFCVCFPILVCFQCYGVWRTNKESKMQGFYLFFNYAFNKLSVAEMKMLSSSCGKTRGDKI